MSHAFVNQLIHIMWSTAKQDYFITPSLKNELRAYITALVKQKNGVVLTTGGSLDHLHLMITLPPEISLSYLISYLKSNSSRWLKTHKTIDPNFCWQDGYLAVSTQEDRKDKVCSYIKSNEDLHQLKNKSYSEELLEMLKLQNIEYNEYFLKNSYSKVYVHVIWSTHNRMPCLDKGLRSDLYYQMNQTISNARGVVHAIGGIEDHVHLLVEMPKDKALADLMREVKTSATHWLKANNKSKYGQFEWQTGYGAFTLSLANFEIVKNYIGKQEEHHSQHSSKDEWNDFLIHRGYKII